MPFLSVVAVVRRVFCRIKSSLKLFFLKNTIKVFFSLEKLSVVSHASCPRLAKGPDGGGDNDGFKYQPPTAHAMKVTLEASLVSVTDEPLFPNLIWKNLAKAFTSPPPQTGSEYISIHLYE